MGNLRQRFEIYSPGNENALAAPVIHTTPKTPAAYLRSFLFISLCCCASVLIFALVLFPLAILSYVFPATLGGDKILTDLISLALLPMRLAVDPTRNLFDFRRPVLFLRSHADDGLLIGRENFGAFSRTSGQEEDDAFEALMAKHLMRYGPLVALRTSYQSQVPFHFRRYLVDQTQWQRQILYWIRRASLIVIQLGPEVSMSDPRYGLAWEITAVLAMNCPHKVLIVLPPVEDDERRRRWKAYQRVVIAECGVADVFVDNAIGLVATCEPGWKHTIEVSDAPTPANYSRAFRSAIKDRYYYRMPLIKFAITSVLVLSVIFLAYQISL